ncbi:MAG: cation:proton antiporter [Synechococcaceae cyanobacterium]|nr:cation:proton antiporter [Synechococcaceae cyanobacterium]
MASERIGLIWGLSFFAGSIAQLLARLVSLPAVVALLATGLLVGRAGLDLIDPDALGNGLRPLVGLLVSLVLFDGGLNLRLAGRDLQRAVVQLVLVRWVLGLVGAAAAAHLLAGLGWSLAFVFGAIVLATGPTVVMPMVRQMRLDPALAQLLEGEGLILEPVGAVLALLLLQLALGNLHGWQEVASRLVLRLGGGVVLGGLAGLLLSEVLRRLTPQDPHLPAEEAAKVSALELQLTLGVLFLLFSGCDTLLPEAGLPAAVSAGVVVGLRLDADATELDELIRQLAMLAITVLFPLLAADLRWDELSPLGWGGVACVLALMLLRWPLMQLAGLGVPSLDGRQKLLLSWIAPRGIVTAAVASLFALRVEEAGLEGAGALKGLVFLTILLTVVLQGFTAPWLARRLGLVGPGEGAEELPEEA